MVSPSKALSIAAMLMLLLAASLLPEFVVGHEQPVPVDPTHTILNPLPVDPVLPQIPHPLPVDPVLPQIPHPLPVDPVLPQLPHPLPVDPVLPQLPHHPLPVDPVHHPLPVDPVHHPVDPFDENAQTVDPTLLNPHPFDESLPEIVPGVPIAKPTHPDISIADTEADAHDFKPGTWKHAHATFYTGDSESFGGACGYDVHKDGYGEGTAALSTTMFQDGAACGACFEIKCVDNPKWCKPGQPSLFITGTNFCPPNFHQDADYGGWCNPPRDHFDISYPAFKHIAEYKVGVIPVAYRRVTCKKHGGIMFTIKGNKHFTLVKIWNVGGAGEITHVDVKGDDKLDWTPLSRNWGTKWQSSCSLEHESLTFKVTTSDGRSVVSPHVTPNKYWHYGHTFEGLNFR